MQSEADSRAVQDRLGRLHWSPGMAVAALFLLAFVARCAVWVFLTPDWIPTSDSNQYLQIAASIADGDGFAMQFPASELHPTAFRPPLFPALLAPLVWLGGGALWPMRLLMVLIGSTNAVLSQRLVAQLFTARAGWVAGLAVAMYPPLVVGDSVVLSEGLALLLILLSFTALARANWVSLGLALGLLVLTRPNAYLFAGIVAVFAIQLLGRRRAGLALVLAVAVVSPWIVRNTAAVGSPRITTSEGFNLAAIYSEQAQDAGGFVDPISDVRFNEPKFRWAQFDEGEWNRVLTDAGISGLLSNPGYVIDVVKQNVPTYFELQPSRNNWPETMDGRHLGLRRWSLPLFYVTTVVGVYGLWLGRSNLVFRAVAVSVSTFVVLSIAFIAVPRLRAPFDLACCLGVGVAVDAFLSARLPRSTEHVVALPSTVSISEPHRV